MQLGTPHHHFESVPSTNDLAKEGIAAGIAEGSLYTADHQTRGRGRRGASWSDAPGASALMSVVLYPPFPISDAWVLSFAAALSVCEAVRSLSAPAEIKWPNDILLTGRKLAGVLVETARAAAEGRYGAVVGIGVNVAQQDFPDSDGYAMQPISLSMALRADSPAAAQVVAGVMSSLSRRYAQCAMADGKQELLRAWRSLLIIGESQQGIDIETGRKVRGILRDVRLTDGTALLEEQDGTFTVARPVEMPGAGS